jgi:hypothetical protein
VAITDSNGGEGAAKSSYANLSWRFFCKITKVKIYKERLNKSCKTRAHPDAVAVFHWDRPRSLLWVPIYPGLAV